MAIQIADRRLAGELSTLPLANEHTSAPTKDTALSACQTLISGLKLPTRMPISANMAGGECAHTDSQQ